MTHVLYSPEEIAEKAYVAFCGSMGNVEQNGQRCAPWHSLPTAQKAAWMAATQVVVTSATAPRGPNGGATDRELELQGKLPAAAAAKKHQEANGHKKARAHAHSAR